MSDKTFLFKIVIVGRISTGKTSIVRRISSGLFSECYKATIGVDFSLKMLPNVDGNYVNIQLWDIAGGIDRSPSNKLFGDFCRGAKGVFIVCSMDPEETQSIEQIKDWKESIESQTTDNPVYVLLANKADKIEDPANYPKAIATQAASNGIDLWYPVSAKTGLNITADAMNENDAVMAMARRCLKKEQPREFPDPGTVQLTGGTSATLARSSCC